MSEKKYMIQNFVPVAASELVERVRELHSEGHRLSQICCSKVESGFELLYCFDKDHELLNLRLNISEDQEVMSVTNDIWYAFIYENEIHDLFGVTFKFSALDYGGHFFKVSEATPWNPKNDTERTAE